MKLIAALFEALMCLFGYHDWQVDTRDARFDNCPRCTSRRRVA